MEVSVAVALLEEVFRDVIDADATAVTACLRASRRLRSALDARDANLHEMLASSTSYPEKVIADTEQSTVKAAQKKMRRAAKQDFLRAHAFISILSGGGIAVGRPEFIVVIDERHVGPDGEPIVDFGQPFDIPWSVIQAMRANARNYRIVVRDGAIVSAQGTLNLERSTRLANRAQRRALRALYPTCAIPGCGVRYGYTSIHHVIWWEHHGPTNLDNLLPLCSRHHHNVHDEGWRLNLKANRQLTIALPDGTTMTTRPPKRYVA